MEVDRLVVDEVLVEIKEALVSSSMEGWLTRVTNGENNSLHAWHGMLGLVGIFRELGNVGGYRWWRSLASSSDHGGGPMRVIEWIEVIGNGCQMVGSWGVVHPFCTLLFPLAMQ